MYLKRGTYLYSRTLDWITEKKIEKPNTLCERECGSRVRTVSKKNLLENMLLFVVYPMRFGVCTLYFVCTQSLTS